MAEPVRHRQTKGAATDMFDLPPPRHISTLRDPVAAGRPGEGPLTEPIAATQPRRQEPLFMPQKRSRTGSPTRSIGRSAAMRAVPADGEVAVLRQMFADILSLIARLRASPASA